jgi:hypothetical protein
VTQLHAFDEFRSTGSSLRFRPLAEPVAHVGFCRRTLDHGASTHFKEIAMKQAWLQILIISLVTQISYLKADTIRLRDGKALDGTFVGGSVRNLELLMASGETVKVPLDTVQSVNFSQPQTTAARSRDAAPSPKAVTIPAGTSFRVRTVDLIDVDATKAGAKFAASLDDPIMLGGDVIVPRGAEVALVATKVDQGGRFKGSDLVELKVNSIKVRGRAFPVVTSLAETKSAGDGKKSTRKVLGGTGLGAIVGGIAGGGTGAAIGALAGGAAGTAMAASGQPHLKIPAETRLQFQLISDWKIQ